MGRKILVPTTVEAALRARHTLVAMALVALLALALAAPVSAQEETPNRTQTVAKDKDASGDQYQLVQGGEQQAEEASTPTTARASDPIQGAEVTIESAANGTVERVELAAVGCDVEKGATLTVRDGNDVEQTFTNIGDVTAEGASNIVATEDQILVTDIEDDLSNGFGTSNTGEVTDSSGITCGRDDDEDDNNENENGGDDKGTEDLSCEELLVLFRGESSSGEQYADAAFFADSEVRAQVEVCLEKEIVEGTAADEDLPDTGGVSLLALAVLGVVSAAAGLSVIRGGRR